MNNKYYKPSIEEFHAGFEYELFHLSNEEWTSEAFCGTEYLYEYWEDEYGDQYNIIDALEDGHVRVKYLDEQDVLDLGFKKLGMSYEKDKISVRLLQDKWLLVVKLEEVQCLPHLLLTIKNKSELEQILKML